jgi:hypothetical protein
MFKKNSPQLHNKERLASIWNYAVLCMYCGKFHGKHLNGECETYQSSSFLSHLLCQKLSIPLCRTASGGLWFCFPIFNPVFYSKMSSRQRFPHFYTLQTPHPKEWQAQRDIRLCTAATLLGTVDKQKRSLRQSFVITQCLQKLSTIFNFENIN